MASLGFDTLITGIFSGRTHFVSQMIATGFSGNSKENPQEVLASWLFAQYLLSNDVQIAYSQTEGYVPVTSKAQDSEIYQDYLSRAGEDNDLYYDVNLPEAC